MSAIHYIVRVKLIRVVDADNIDFIVDKKVFKDEDPILARERAFSFYNSYIDSILEPNLEHNQVIERISSRIFREKIDYDVDLSTWSKDENTSNEIKPTRYELFSGIGVFMVVDEPINDDEIGDEFLIHGVGSNSTSPQSLIDHLNFEYWYYQHYKYNENGHKIEIDFYEADIDEVGKETILKTPFNWDSLDLEGDRDNNESNNSKSNTLSGQFYEDLIRRGEGHQIEFKSSLVSYKNKDGATGYSRHVVFKIVKTIASFLNSNGGLLFIGVKDDLSIIGLETDFSLADQNRKDPYDYFKLEVDQIVMKNFKKSATFISGDFIKLDDKYIYIFKIEPSPVPVFVNNTTDKEVEKHAKEFYVRLAGASSVLYADTEEIVEYYLNHWNKKA